MIREMYAKDQEDIDRMQFELQKYFSDIDRAHESLPYKNMGQNFFLYNLKNIFQRFL